MNSLRWMILGAGRAGSRRSHVSAIPNFSLEAASPLPTSGMQLRCPLLAPKVSQVCTDAQTTSQCLQCLHEIVPGNAFIGTGSSGEEVRELAVTLGRLLSADTLESRRLLRIITSWLANAEKFL